MNRRNFFKTVTGFVAVFVPKTKSSPKYPNKYDCEDWHLCTERDCSNCKGSWMEKRTLRTEVYVDHRFITSYDRGLTDKEASSILDANNDADVTFLEFGWRKY